MAKSLKEQLALFSTASTPESRVTNVASVPHRSPFRYPGGKTWLIPRIRTWLRSQTRPVNVFVEPFCGGAITALTVAFERLASHVVMSEVDDDVASVWKAVLGGHAEALARRIETFEMSEANLDAALAQAERSGDPIDLAFATVLRNRVNRGGILAPGAGRVKTGENGKGLLSRWYPATLARRIREIDLVKTPIEFVHGDAFATIDRFRGDRHAVLFVDPPYTAPGKRAGSRLYAHHVLDHERLFDVCAAFAGDILLTYDRNDAVIAIAEQRGLSWRAVAMKSTHHAVMNELLIGKDLSWLDRDRKP